jgi:hypothetical protein
MVTVTEILNKTMFPIRVFARIGGALTELTVKQVDPLHAHYEVNKDGHALGKLNRVNNQWYADEDSSLHPTEVSAIGQAIDNMLESQDF